MGSIPADRLFVMLLMQGVVEKIHGIRSNFSKQVVTIAIKSAIERVFDYFCTNM
jgi:hypothetical protein